MQEIHLSGSIALFVGEKGRWKTPLRGKVQERDFPTYAWKSRTERRDFHFLPTAATTTRGEILMFA